MTQETNEAAVLRVATGVLKQPVTADSSRENTPNWDSLKQVELVFAIEDEFGLQFDEEQIEMMDSIATIVRLVEHAS